MTDFATLKYETSGGKAYITLNRPDRLNAIDARMPSDIRTRWQQPMTTTRSV